MDFYGETCHDFIARHQTTITTAVTASAKWGHPEEWPLTRFFADSKPCLYNGIPAHFADSPQMESVYKMLSSIQPPTSPETLAKLYRPASVVDKAHIHSRYDKPFRKQYSLGLQQWSGSHSLEQKLLKCLFELKMFVSISSGGWTHPVVSCSREFKKMTKFAFVLNTLPSMK